MKINFAFFGTPDVASKTLEILKKAGYVPSLIVTSPDAKQGRGMQLKSSPVADFAVRNNIHFIKPKEISEIKNTDISQFDLAVVVAYGQILPDDLINAPRLGSINIHYSLLPKYRGASPVESAILNGETETGVTIQKMVYEVDAGGILAQSKINILPDETAPQLRERLIAEGGRLLTETLPKIEELKPAPQDPSLASHARKIKKEDGLVDLNAPAVENYNKFRAYARWPRIYFFKDGKRIIITRARLENGKFIIEKIIPENGKETDFNTYR